MCVLKSVLPELLDFCIFEEISKLFPISLILLTNTGVSHYFIRRSFIHYKICLTALTKKS